MTENQRQAVTSRPEIVRVVAGLLHEWEQSGELYREAAERIVDYVLSPDKGVRQPNHESDDIAG